MIQFSAACKLQSQADFKVREDVKKHLSRTWVHKEKKYDWVVP